MLRFYEVTDIFVMSLNLPPWLFFLFVCGFFLSTAAVVYKSMCFYVSR